MTSLNSSLQQRKLPLISINLQSCSLTHKSLLVFNTALIVNNNLLTNLQILNLSGNRIKEENVDYKNLNKFYSIFIFLVYNNFIS